MLRGGFAAMKTLTEEFLLTTAILRAELGGQHESDASLQWPESMIERKHSRQFRLFMMGGACLRACITGEAIMRA